MNNKLLLVFAMAFLFVGLVSAGVEFVESEGEYGKYVIDTWVPDWLGGEGESIVTLVDNTNDCIINCEATIEFNLEESVSLIEDINFLDKKGNDISEKIEDLSFQIGNYEEVEKIDYSSPIYDTVKTCDIINETMENNSQNCYYKFLGYSNYTTSEIVWKDYNGEKVVGKNYLKIKAIKNPSSKIDWIITFRGEELKKWAWWGDYDNYEIFNTTGSGSWNVPSKVENITVLVIGGGGAGSFTAGGGGGAGGVIFQNYTVTPEATINYYVGKGGTQYNTTANYNGENTTFGDLTAIGGGNGGWWNVVGFNGGSGGGGSWSGSVGGTGLQPTSEDGGYGNNGGTGYITPNSIDRSGGGGGGANETGAAGSFGAGGDGGDGIFIWNTYWAGGGGGSAGSAGTAGSGGLGGGGAGAIAGTQGESGLNGTGSGGGGGDGVGMGGSGIIILAWNDADGRISIDYVTPPTPENNSNLSVNYIPVEVEINYTNATLDNITYDFYKGGELNQSYFFTNETLFVNHTGCQCDNWAFNVTACYTEQINDNSFCTTTETRYLIIDSQPPVINITSPLTTYDYLYNYTLDLNWSVEDEAGHLDSCWYEYNGTNNSVTCNDNTTTFNYIPNVNNLTFYANDTFGNLGSELRSWSVRVLEDNVIYNEETTEGSYETFILELTKGSSIQIQSAILHYDGQNVSSQIFVDNNDIEIRANLVIPSVESDTNNTFYWTLNLVGGEVINTRNFTQQVNKILIGNCSTYSNSLINLLLKDEGTKSLINGTIQTNLRILNNLNYGLAYEFIGENTNVNNVNLCSNINLTETDFLLNAEIRYFAENHSSEFYHIQRANLTDYPVNLSLYTLAEEDTTIFTVIYRNQQLIGVEGAIIQLQRKYVNEGIFEIVEAPLTSSESKAVLHIDTDTNKYQIVVVKNGEVLGLFENLVFVCQSELTGECILNLFETISAPELPTLTEMTDFTYSIFTNDTSQEVQVLFSVPSGTPNEVQVVLIQKDILGSSTICNETLISSSGSIICDYNKSIQDSTLELKIYNSGNLVAQKGYVVSDNILEDFGGVNYIILIIFVISLAFMAISSPEWIIINAVISLLIGGLTWLVRGLDFVVGIGGLIWLVVAAIILVSKISKQEDQ